MTDLFFSGWDPERENWAALDALPSGVPFGDDYAGIPKAVKPPSEWIRIERQVRNDCRGHSGSSGAEICRYYATGEIVQLSPHFCYLGAQAYLGGGRWDRSRIRDQGSTISDGCVLLKEVGICPEASYPYPRNRFVTSISDSQIADAAPYKVDLFQRLQSPREVRQWLESGMGYVDAGVRWGNGYHAICYCEMVGDKFRYLNSWGPDWDGDGMAEDSERALAARFNDRYAVFIGVSGQANAEPPEFDWAGNPDWGMA